VRLLDSYEVADAVVVPTLHAAARSQPDRLLQRCGLFVLRAASSARKSFTR
jgi:hypothetical protein